MELTKLKAERIIDTLPIGYYVGRDIPVQVDEEQKCSSYAPKVDSITISLPQLRQGTEKTSTPEELENMVRSNFYHEISHAILTPSCIKPTDIVNIFEDERIETLLRDFYIGVDFKKSLKAINGEHPTPSLNPLSQFFSLVRYRVGNAELLAEVDSIIKDFAHLNRTSKSYLCNDYLNRIYDLYKNFNDEMTREEFFQQMKSDEKGIEVEAEESTETRPDKDKEKVLSRAEIVSITADALNGEQPFNQSLYDSLAVLFENYKRKNSGGSSLQAYSGVINPRNVNRDDYRIFDRPSPIRGSNQFGTFHLNLFVDTSGSFCSNDNIVNSFFQVLDRLEVKFPMFSYDVITTGPMEMLLPRDRRRIRSIGGNHLSKRIFEICRDQQFPQTFNYNIVMFDGDAYSNDCSISSSLRLPNGKGFQAFANSNYTIITDEENAPYIKKYCPTTRTIFTTDFCEEFIKNIQQIMATALS